MESKKLTLTGHKLGGSMCLVQQCPACMRVIDAGLYSIQNDTMILGQSGEHHCEYCDAPIERPLLFKNANSAQTYLNEINLSLDGVMARFIPKAKLELAHINMKFLQDDLFPE